jgi:hypothetical protein
MFRVMWATGLMHWSVMLRWSRKPTDIPQCVYRSFLISASQNICHISVSPYTSSARTMQQRSFLTSLTAVAAAALQCARNTFIQLLQCRGFVKIYCRYYLCTQRYTIKEIKTAVCTYKSEHKTQEWSVKCVIRSVWKTYVRASPELAT